MKRVNIVYILLFMVLIFIPTSQANGQHFISVAGMIIDDNGNPVEDALVKMLYPPCKTCIDHIIPSYRTSKEGVFFIDGENIKAKEVKILIEGRISKGLWNPLSPVDLTLGRFPEFRGIIINTSSNSGKTVQLGKVSPHIKYRAVSIDLLNLFKADKTFLENSSLLKMKIKYKDVTITEDVLVEERYFNKTENKVDFVLPEGKWELMFEISNGNQKKIGSVLVDLELKNQPIYKYHIKCN